MDWFLYDNDLRHERVNANLQERFVNVLNVRNLKSISNISGVSCGPL